MWSTMMELQSNSGSAIVITSHTIEECEALCDRITIMVNGKFRCLGPAQVLRTTFGQGYTVVAKLQVDIVNQNPEARTKAQLYLNMMLPKSVLKGINKQIESYRNYI